MPDFAINHTETSRVDDKTLSAHIKAVSAYRDSLQEIVEDGAYNQPESALNLADDDDLLESIAQTAQTLTKNGQPKAVVVIGMGGSVRGTQAVYELARSSGSAEMFFLDSVSSSQVAVVVDKLEELVDSLDDLVVCVVSKSGTTAETVANANVFLQSLKDRFNSDAVTDRFVAITEASSELNDQADDLGIQVETIPEQVGGRFSVLSAVGLLPLLLAGIDIRALRTGAKEMRASCLSGRAAADPSAALAGILYAHTESARRIINHFLFATDAQALGRWSQQLFAESLGKQRSQQGEPVYAGMYPTTTIGPDDLHSLYQLQMGGPKNFVSVFVRETDTDRADFTRTIDDTLLPSDLQHLSGKTLGDVYTAIAEGTLKSFRAADRPFVDITVSRLAEKQIGKFILLQELVVMYLGELMNVNAFNQPQVEKYKSNARALLKEGNS